MIHLQENLTPRKIITARHEGIQDLLNDRPDHADDPPPNFLLQSLPLFGLLLIKPQMLHASRAIRVGQPVRILWNVVETQEGSQRHPLLETAAGGPLTGLLIVPHLIAHAANRDKQDLFDDVHVRPPFGLSTIN